jgi:hypothetical protein
VFEFNVIELSTIIAPTFGFPPKPFTQLTTLLPNPVQLIPSDEIAKGFDSAAVPAMSEPIPPAIHRLPFHATAHPAP